MRCLNQITIEREVEAGRKREPTRTTKKNPSSPKEPKNEESELNMKDMLRMLIENQQRSLEVTLKTLSPIKEKTKEDEDHEKKQKELDRDDQEDQRIKVVDIEELPPVTEGNSAVKCGDWLHRISPTMTNLSRRAGQYWKRTIEVVNERYKIHQEATPLNKLTMTYEEVEEETDPRLSKVRSVITEMLLKALPKDLSAEAITKRLDDPMKILHFIMVKYQPGGRKET